MHVAAIDTLCDLIAEGVEHVGSAALEGEAMRACLTDWGAIVENGVTATVWCDQCDEGHFATVRRDPDGFGLAWTCPEAGVVIAPAERFRRFRVQPATVVRALADGLTRLRTFDPKHGNEGLWRLGQFDTSDFRVELLLSARAADGERLSLLRHVIRGLPPCHLGVILSAEQIGEPLQVQSNWWAVSLRDHLEVSGYVRLRVDAGELERTVRWLRGEAAQARSGRPSGLAATKRVFEHLQSRGELVEGRNRRSRQIANAWPSVFGNRAPPSEATIRRHLTELAKEA